MTTIEEGSTKESPTLASASASTPTRYLIKRPKALQWFHNGRLEKEGDADEERVAGRFELFLDLLCKPVAMTMISRPFPPY